MSKNERPFSDGARQMDSGGIFMRRKIVKIDRDKCNGCGACAAKCPRKAIVMRDRRAPRNKMDKVKKAPVAPAAKPAAPAAAKEPEQKA